MLCKVCDEIFRGKFLNGQWQAHHINVTDLQQAVLKECWVCERLWGAMITTYWGHDGSAKNITTEKKERLLIRNVRIYPNVAHVSS